MALVSSIMHRHRFRLLRYLDDWLVLGSTFQELVRARDFHLWLCRLLGVIVNPSKSSLVPTQTLDYLGMMLETSPLRVFLALKRVQKFSLLLQDFLSDCLHPVSVRRSLLGMMSSMSAIIPGLFRQNTYLRNKKHTLTCQGGTVVVTDFNYQPGS